MWLAQGHTDSDLSVPWGLSSVQGCCILSPHCQQKQPLRAQESHVMCWLSLCPLRCILCSSLPCSVSRRLGPLPLPLASSQCQRKFGGFILHLPSGQVMVFPVAVLLRNGCDLGQAASFQWLQPLPDSCYTAPFCLL